MEFVIKNASTGDTATVKNGRLYVFAISESVTESASRTGDSYNVNTGDVTLTSATESGILYFKNNGTNSLIITTIGFLLGNSTGGTGDLVLRVLSNPTAGTVISDETPVDININKNVGSSNTLSVSAYKGGEGKTITGGVESYKTRLAGAARFYSINTGSLTIPKGKSIGVLITPQPSNTSMICEVFLSVIENKLNGTS